MSGCEAVIVGGFHDGMKVKVDPDQTWIQMAQLEEGEPMDVDRVALAKYFLASKGTRLRVFTPSGTLNPDYLMQAYHQRKRLLRSLQLGDPAIITEVVKEIKSEDL